MAHQKTEYLVANQDAINHIVSTTAGSSDSSNSPNFGEVVVISSGIGLTTNKKIFSFKADASDERAEIVDLFQYFSDEMATGRKVGALFGQGEYGFDGRGISQNFANGSNGLSMKGMGQNLTRIGFVGNTQSGPDWRIMQFKPTNKAQSDITGITQLGGVATVNLAAHGAIIGETVRIYNALQDEYNGLKVVTGITDPNNFTYDVDAATVTPATFDSAFSPDGISCAVHSRFLKNFEISDIGFFDSNPAAHAGPTEETHAIGIFETKGLVIKNVYSETIGDEFIELQDCENFKLINISSVGTPAAEQTGGGSISLKTGCHNGIIDGFIIENSGSSSLTTYGIIFKQVVHPENTSNIIISNGIIINAVEAGLQFNLSSASVENISINNVKIIGSKYGVKAIGGTAVLRNITLENLDISKSTESNIFLSRLDTSLFDVSVNNCILDGAKTGDKTSSLCVNLSGGTRVKFNNNIYKNARSGVLFGSSSRDCEINGGLMNNIGASPSGGASTFNQYVYDLDATSSNSVNGLKITNGKVPLIGIRSVPVVKNVEFYGTNVEPTSWAVQDAKTIIGCILNYNARLNFDDGKAINNTFIQTASGSNGAIRVNGVKGCIVNGNSTPNLTSGNGCSEAAGSTLSIITGNNFNARPVVTVDINSITQGGNL